MQKIYRILAVLGGIALTTYASGVALADSITFDGYGVTTNGTATSDGANLQLTNNQGGASATAFITNPFILDPATSFIATFNFQISNNGAQGINEFLPYEGNGGFFFFDIQNCSDATYTGGGDCAQIRAAFNADEGTPQSPSDLTIPYGQAQIQQNGGGGPFSPLEQFNLHSSLARGTAGPFDSLPPSGPYDVVNGSVTVKYDSTTGLFYLLATDDVGGNVNFSMPFNLFGDLDTNGNVFQPPPYGYIGFGAGTTSAGLSQIEISNLNISMVEGALPSASTPEPGTAGTLIVGSGFLFALMFYRRQRSTRKE